MQGDIFDADVLGINIRYNEKRGIVGFSLGTIHRYHGKNVLQ